VPGYASRPGPTQLAIAPRCRRPPAAQASSSFCRQSMQMSVTLRVGRKTAAGIATLGAAVVATFVALCLALPSVRHGSGLELLFGGLAALACVVIVVRPVAVRAERAAWAMFALAIAFNTVTE